MIGIYDRFPKPNKRNVFQKASQNAQMLYVENNCMK